MVGRISKKAPFFSLRTVEKLSYVRSIASDPIVLDQYFDMLERTLSDNNLFDNPATIFNCDETGLPLEHTPSSIVAVKGQKHPRVITSGTKRQITVLGCANAAGYALPQLVIFSRKSLLLSVRCLPPCMD